MLGEAGIKKKFEQNNNVYQSSFQPQSQNTTHIEVNKF